MESPNTIHKLNEWALLVFDRSVCKPVWSGSDLDLEYTDLPNNRDHLYVYFRSTKFEVCRVKHSAVIKITKVGDQQTDQPNKWQVGRNLPLFLWSGHNKKKDVIQFFCQKFWKEETYSPFDTLAPCVFLSAVSTFCWTTMGAGVTRVVSPCGNQGFDQPGAVVSVSEIQII